MAQDLFFSSSAASTTLSSGISNSATSMTVGSVTGYPVSFPYLLILDPDTASEEVVLVTAAGGTTLTVTRGYDSTTGLSHSAGAVVQHGVSAKAFNDLYTVKDTAVTLAGSQTLTNKILTAPALTAPTATGSLTGFGAAWTSWTPTVTQAVSVSITSNASTYLQIGKLVVARYSFTTSSNGTDSNNVVLSVPVAAISTAALHGSGDVMAIGTSLWSSYAAFGTSASALSLRSGLTTYLGSSAGNRANVDWTQVYGTIVYEAA